MRVRVLGCSGGIGGSRQTTSFLVDDDILVDAGSGVMSLGLKEMMAIRHVFITHTHLDHVMALPTLMDSVGVGRVPPLTVHAIPEVVDILRRHMFNWDLWPDFEKVPTVEHPFMRFVELAVGQVVDLEGRRLTPIPANHGRPAVGYIMRGKESCLLFSGDTTSHEALWHIANDCPNLRHMVVECSFASRQRAIADAASHYCPITLLPDLATLKPGVETWITHLKPGGEDEIMEELRAAELPNGRPMALQQGQVFEL